jgi:deoxyhypusine synthase
VVDQDFFEGLGFHHYQGTPFVDDNVLRELHIDRIYDHFIDEDELRECDATVGRILDALPPRAYSSRELVAALGRHLVEHGKAHDGFVEACWRKHVPVFVPAFSDCSAGFGFVEHQDRCLREGRPMVTLDVARDFLELTYLKVHAARDSGLIMLGGGVPKNFAQDIVVAADVLGHDAPMHKYAVQLTVADERDGALSGSTLREASSWGKVATTSEQMVFGEATITLPLLAGATFARGAHRKRRARELARWFKTDGRFDYERAAARQGARV